MPAASVLAEKALWIALGQVGAKEVGGPNRGPEVDGYLRAVGLEPEGHAYPWCAAFVYWCFAEAARQCGDITNRCPRTASAMKMLTLGEKYRIDAPARAAIFGIDHGGGRGHCGIVVDVGPRNIVTVEGNTNAWGSREGNCVFVHVRPQHAIAGYILL